MDPHYYQVNVKWETDRKGLVFSPELDQSFTVATPPPFQGGIDRTWSPEHLLTASVNSCFMTTFLAIAANSKLEFSNFECESKGKLEQVEGKYLMTEIVLMPVLTINKSGDQERAERILLKSEAACLISNSIKSKVILQPIIKVN